MSRTSNPGIYNAWRGMRDRCRNTKRKDAHCYALKGIDFSPEWDKFSAFESWALENGYVVGLTLERKDGDLGYSPQNCTWATRKEQARNLSKNLRLEFNGESLCLSEWAERTGISSGLILARITRLSWTVDAALTVPTGVIPTGPKPRAWAC